MRLCVKLVETNLNITDITDFEKEIFCERYFFIRFFNNKGRIYH